MIQIVPKSTSSSYGKWDIAFSFRSFCKQNLEPVDTYEFCNVLNAFLVFEITQNRIKYLNKIKT